MPPQATNYRFVTKTRDGSFAWLAHRHYKGGFKTEMRAVQETFNLLICVVAW